MFFWGRCYTGNHLSHITYVFDTCFPLAHVQNVHWRGPLYSVVLKQLPHQENCLGFLYIFKQVHKKEVFCPFVETKRAINIFNIISRNVTVKWTSRILILIAYPFHSFMITSHVIRFNQRLSLKANPWLNLLVLFNSLSPVLRSLCLLFSLLNSRSPRGLLLQIRDVWL